MGIQAISSSTTAVDMSTLSRAASASASTSQVSPPQKTGAAPPVGNVAKPVAASDSTSSSNSAKIYDKRDTNQDGTVSYQEELLYALKSPATEAQSQSAVSAGQMQSGLKAYQQIQQASGMTTSTSLFAI